MLVKAGIIVCLSSLGLNQFNLFKEKILIIRIADENYYSIANSILYMSFCICHD